ncbi:MAG: hypothetical protein HOW73_43985 [Polyangiaceae bacterium]|nr:hypothetical protein [Polyangiaceae bacterium]
MGTHDITYVWTKADHAIREAQKNKVFKPCGGGYPQCLDGTTVDGTKVHTCFVTPYGIRAEKVDQGEVGKPRTIDLSLAAGGQPGLADRFHVALPWYPIPKDPTPAQKAAPPFAADGEWIKYSIPAGIDTLGQLCAHLAKTDVLLYPSSVYGAGRVNQAARMLFDYWQNGEYRNATVAEGFDWSTYSRNPQDIKIERGGKSLQWVLRKPLIAPAAASPNTKIAMRVDPDLFDAVKGYIGALTACIQKVNGALELTRKSIQRRFQLLYKLHAVRAIVDVIHADIGKPSSLAGEIRDRLDEVLPEAYDFLLHLPTKRAASTEARIQEFLSENRDLTMNAGASLEQEAEKLKELLYESEHWRDTLKKWAASVVAQMHTKPIFPGQPKPREVTQLEQLAETMALAQEALTEAAQINSADAMRELYDKIPESHARSGADVKGDSPMEVVLSIVGRGSSITTTLVGNTAGPPSLSIAILQSHAAWRYASLARSTLGRIKDATSLKKELDAFARDVLDRLPITLNDRTKLREQAKKALLAGDKAELDKLANELGALKGGDSQTSVRWKGAVTILSIVSAVLAIRDSMDKGEKSELTIPDFLSTGATVGTAAIGSIDTVLSYVGKLERVTKLLTAAGNAIGLLGAIVSVSNEWCAYQKAYKSGDGIGLAKTAASTPASLGMVVVSAAAMVNVALPVVSAISLGLLVISGVVDAFNASASGPNAVCLGVVKEVRANPLWSHIESENGKIHLGMRFVQDQLEQEWLGHAGPYETTKVKLRKAGIPEEIIQRVVMPEAPTMHTPIPAKYDM